MKISNLRYVTRKVAERYNPETFEPLAYTEIKVLQMYQPQQTCIGADGRPQYGGFKWVDVPEAEEE